MRFEVDHMLVKLGKYLRILGYDADWDTRLRTHELILKANREGRIFLTRNRQLADQYPKPLRSVEFASDDPAEQFNMLVGQLRLDTQSRLFSKCIRCNAALDPVADKESIRAKVHPNVFQRYDRFFTCPQCGTVFWHGSHVRNTCRKLGIDVPGA